MVALEVRGIGLCAGGVVSERRVAVQRTLHRLEALGTLVKSLSVLFCQFRYVDQDTCLLKEARPSAYFDALTRVRPKTGAPVGMQATYSLSA